MAHRVFLRTVFFLVSSVVASNPANAQALANDMTCAQAQAQFERHGRVTIRTRGGAILPIYGGVPTSQRGRLICEPFSVKTPKFIVTSDKRQCAISYKCT